MCACYSATLVCTQNEEVTGVPGTSGTGSLLPVLTIRYLAVLVLQIERSTTAHFLMMTPCTWFVCASCYYWCTVIRSCILLFAIPRPKHQNTSVACLARS